MKKLFTAILLVAMIASIASVAAFAEDYQPVAISGEAATVEEGATEATIKVSIANPQGDTLGLGSAFVSITAPEGCQVTAVKANVPGKTQVGDLPADSVNVLWVDPDDGAKGANVDFLDVTITLPEGAKVGDVLDVVLTASDDPDNYVSLVEVEGDTPGFGATATNGSVTIVEKKVEPVPGPETTDSDTVTTAPKADETTKKADEGKKAPQTGDVAIIVVAAMIVALGTAIVVKKVNVK